MLKKVVKAKPEKYYLLNNIVNFRMIKNIIKYTLSFTQYYIILN